jgi:hypothetical protein
MWHVAVSGSAFIGIFEAGHHDMFDGEGCMKNLLGLEVYNIVSYVTVIHLQYAGHHFILRKLQIL